MPDFEIQFRENGGLLIVHYFLLIINYKYILNASITFPVIIVNQELNDRIFRFKPGAVIDSRFKLVSRPGLIYQGARYLTRDTITGEHRLLFFVNEQMRNDEAIVANIEYESDLMRWLQHPNIARFYDLHRSADLLYFETEYVTGKNLRTKKQERSATRFSENIIRWLAIEILDALEYAHNINVLHRDIRPQNIVLTPDGQVKLIDFGISEIMRQAVAKISTAPPSSSILYMSPEQLLGQRLTIASDIYAFGATLYDLAAGQPPFMQGDVYRHILNSTPDPIQNISGALNNIILKCLQKNQSARYQEAGEIKDDIARTAVYHFQPETETKPEQSAKPGRIKKPISEGTEQRYYKNPGIRHLAMIIFVLTILTFLITIIFYRSSERYPPQKQSGTESEAGAPLDSVQRRLLAAMINEADLKLQRGQLIEPAGQSALFFFNEALHIDPGHFYARQQKSKIRRIIAHQILLTAKLNGAYRQLLNSAGKEAPDDTLFYSLQNIRAFAAADTAFWKKSDFAILNGCGVTGIAKRAAAKLESAGINITYVENVRRNGRMVRDISESYLSGPEIITLPVLVILRTLQISHRNDITGMPNSEAYNAALTLGKDYRNLIIF